MTQNDFIKRFSKYEQRFDFVTDTYRFNRYDTSYKLYDKYGNIFDKIMGYDNARIIIFTMNCEDKSYLEGVYQFITTHK